MCLPAKQASKNFESAFNSSTQSQENFFQFASLKCMTGFQWKWKLHVPLDSFSKITEKVVFIRLYNFLLEIGFLNPLMSGFRPGDSTVNQLVYLVHRIYARFE